MKKMDKEKEKSNTLGIISCCVSWLIPLAGFVLGVISLSKKEKTPAVGIVGIVVSVLFWFFYISVLM